MTLHEAQLLQGDAARSLRKCQRLGVRFNMEEVFSCDCAILIALAVSQPVRCSLPAKAEQFAVGDHVVHTRRAHVAHKVVPPFKGLHVYQGKPPRR